MLYPKQMAVVALAGFGLILGGCVAPTPERPVYQSTYFRPGCDPGFTKTAQYMHKGQLVDVIQDPCAEPGPELQAFLRDKGLHGERLMRAGRHIARNAYPRWEAGYKVWKILQEPSRRKFKCVRVEEKEYECE